MRDNIAAYRHPTIVRKIRLAALRAFMRSGKTGQHERAYVANRKGHNILRVSYFPDSGFRVWGDNARDVSGIIVPLFKNF
jgi:hypothetical protein